MLSLRSSDNKSLKSEQKNLNENYAFIPSGESENAYKNNSIQSYIIAKKEVTNSEYRLFLLDLKKRGELIKLAIATVDSSVWSNSKYKDFYHLHPAYSDYPVVNITKEGAILYCEWLGKKVNQNLAQTSKLVFRLPTKGEWLKAANGNLKFPVYAWGGPYLRNPKGTIMCNFLHLGPENIARNDHGTLFIKQDQFNYFDGDNSDLTAPVKSYAPSYFGLYNMNGNVAEMIDNEEVIMGGSWLDPGFDVRNESQRQYTGADKTVGFRVVASLIPSENKWLKTPKTKLI